MCILSLHFHFKYFGGSLDTLQLSKWVLERQSLVAPGLNYAFIYLWREQMNRHCGPCCKTSHKTDEWRGFFFTVTEAIDTKFVPKHANMKNTTLQNTINPDPHLVKRGARIKWGIVITLCVFGSNWQLLALLI